MSERGYPWSFLECCLKYIRNPIYYNESSQNLWNNKHLLHLIPQGPKLTGATNHNRLQQCNTEPVIGFKSDQCNISVQAIGYEIYKNKMTCHILHLTNVFIIWPIQLYLSWIGIDEKLCELDWKKSKQIALEIELNLKYAKWGELSWIFTHIHQEKLS